MDSSDWFKISMKILNIMDWFDYGHDLGKQEPARKYV